MKGLLRVAGSGTILAGFLAVALSERVVDLPVSQVTVVVVSLVSLCIGLWYVADRRLREVERAIPPDTERGYRVPVPGEQVDRAIEQRRGRTSIRRRLAERARVTLVERGLSRTEAEAAVERGAWTDDRVAAAYLASDGPSIPFGTKVRWMLRGDSRVERCVGHTVAALEELREGRPRE